MLQLLIADDNSVIRKGIINLLDQYNMPFDKIYECSNGKEALEMLNRYPIDLVITDIRMPVMDGIGLIQEAKKTHPRIKFIVLTMYEDFNYAKDSINYGAKAYLVKPIGGSLFYETIDRVVTEIIREKELMKQHKTDSLKLIFLSYEHYKKDIDHKLKSINFRYYGKSFYMGILIEMPSERKEYDNEKDLSQIECCIHELSNQKEVDVFYFVLNNEVVLFSSQHHHLLKVLYSLSNQPAYFMSISQMCTKSTDMYTYYCHARDGLKYRYLFGDKQYVDCHDIRNLKDKGPIPLDSLGKIQQLMGGNNIHEINKILGEVLLKEIIITYKIDYLEAIIQNIHQILEKVTMQLPQTSEKDSQSLKMLESLYNFIDVRHYIHCLREYISSINQSLIIIKQLYKNKEIDTAIHYVQENYYKDITLAVVSNYVSLSYSYFSHAFKEITGISFSEYLREIRVNRSIEYLGSTELKIGEIAVRVGFNTPKNYTRSFKAVMGISPVQYRQNLMTTHLMDQMDSIERVRYDEKK